MAEIDTAAEREAANELIESGEATGQDFADVVPELLDAYDRLQAENQRLERLIVRDAEGRIVTQGAFNAANASVVRLYEENQQLKDELKERSGRINEYADAIRWAVDNYHDLPPELRALVDKVARLAVEATGGGDV